MADRNENPESLSQLVNQITDLQLPTQITKQSQPQCQISSTNIATHTQTNSMSNPLDQLLSKHLPIHRLESILGKNQAKTCVEIRRRYYLKELERLDQIDEQLRLSNTPNDTTLPMFSDATQALAASNISQSSLTTQKRADIFKENESTEFEYDKVIGACCENVVGFVRLPVGIAGPLVLDRQTFFVPMATTEGCLVASTSRGLKALAQSGGVVSRIRKNCMTRAPIVRFTDADLNDALDNVDKAIEWLHNSSNKEKMKTAFRSTSKHTTLVDYTTHAIGRELHIRFEAQTGDAMGMNMCSKGAESALKELQHVFPSMSVLTLSGNMCTDKKPSAVNWIQGRGKSVECNALLSPSAVEEVLKVQVDSIIEVWLKKVMIGSAMAGSVGGFNCQAANIVSSVFIATGQDIGQVGTSSNCLLTLEKDSRGWLAVHCSMPSIECGTVGGGTILPDQGNYLQLLGLRGSAHKSSDKLASSDPMDIDNNACRLARVICATVMAAELSLLASLTEGSLVKSHLTHNRTAPPCKVV